MNRFSSWMYGVRAAELVSKKAPPGALSRMWWNAPGQPMYPDFSGEAAIDLAYLRNVWTYRCIDTIANTIAGWPFRAGDQVTNNYRLTHPLAQLLGPASGSANPNWSSAILWRYAIAQYLLLGKFAWRKEYGPDGTIVGLWPLQAQYLFPVPASEGSNYFEYFKYGVQGQPGYTVFKPKDIVYIYRPSLKDFRQPESPVQAVSVNINISKMLDQFDYSFLKNGGVPAHLIVTPPWATDADRDTFQAQFMSDFSGAANVGKAMFAERDIEPGDVAGTAGYDTVEVKTIGTNQRDAQLATLRDAEIMAITVGWGVPLSILGDASHRTFSNAEDERKNYYQTTCLPRARELQDGVNIQLAKELDATGKTVGWFDVSGIPELKPEPMLPAGSEAVAIQQAGGFQWDEWRAERGLPPQKDVGLVTAEPVKPAPAAVDAGAAVLPPATAPAAARHAGHEHAAITSGHVTTHTLETSLTAALRRKLEEMSQSVSERANGKRAKRGEVTELVDVDYWSRQIADVFVSHQETVPVSDVESALLDLYAGNTTVDSVIAGWNGND